MLATIKSAASTIGNGLLDATTALHNANLDNQISDLDDQANALRQQLVRLEEERSELKARKI